jgi:hypothetical protein
MVYANVKIVQRSGNTDNCGFYVSFCRVTIWWDFHFNITGGMDFWYADTDVGKMGGKELDVRGTINGSPTLQKKPRHYQELYNNWNRTANVIR